MMFQIYKIKMLSNFYIYIPYHLNYDYNILLISHSTRLKLKYLSIRVNTHYIIYKIYLIKLNKKTKIINLN